MAKTVDGVEYLSRAARLPDVAVMALVGDASFVQSECVRRLRRDLLRGGRGEDARSSSGQSVAERADGDEDHDGDFSVSVFPGSSAEWRPVCDELSTRAMFGDGIRLVVVEEAETFVTRFRAPLESYVAKPVRSAVLVLVLASLPSNTRLYKTISETGLIIDCSTPSAARLTKWIVSWARDRHQASIDADAAELLTETVESELGMIDQELAKLAALAGPEKRISSELVHQAVGGWRAKTTWDMLDAALAGDAATAYLQLDRLLLGGEVAISILAQIGATLRRFATATRLIVQAEAERRRITLRQALESAGFKPFVVGKAEAQLRRLGRQRAGELDRWLLELDLELKGASSAPARARTALETLIARLVMPTPAKLSSAALGHSTR